MQIKKIHSDTINRQIFQRVASALAASVAKQEGYTVYEATTAKDRELARKVKAIVKAGILVSEGIWFTAFAIGDKVAAVTVGSATTPGVGYAPTESACQCLAFENGYTCWHRQLAVILELYAEVEFYENRLRESYAKVGIGTTFVDGDIESVEVEEVVFTNILPAEQEQFLEAFREEFVGGDGVRVLFPAIK